MRFVQVGCFVLLGAMVFGANTAAFAQKQQVQAPAAEPLTRADFIAQMDAEFARFDADGNGMVLPEEIAQAQRNSAQIEALRQNRLLFGQLDKDANGALDADEFAALANPAALPVDPQPMMNGLDTDRDGVITLVEYRIATQSNFDRIDTDRDGVVTNSEMSAAGLKQ